MINLDTMQAQYEHAVTEIQTQSDRRMVMFWETVADSISFEMLRRAAALLLAVTLILSPLELPLSTAGQSSAPVCVQVGCIL